MGRKEAVTILQEKRDLTRKLEAAEKSADWAAKDRVDSSSLRASQHGRYADALNMAISALSPPNEPLTLEELRAELEQMAACVYYKQGGLCRYGEEDPANVCVFGPCPHQRSAQEVFATQEMCADVLSAVHHLPAADVAPVRHGRWVFDGGDEYADHYHCDQCGAKTDLCNEIYTEQKPNYCPNCGARMGKEDEHEQ